jgi:tungstate transport system substrate-binding protein
MMTMTRDLLAVNVRTGSAVLLLAGLAWSAACSPAPAPPLELATTTSMVNSGLLASVLPGFHEPVRVHAAGSGRALAMLADQIVDLVISHAPDAEARALAEHPDWRYRKVAFNHFIIVGPPADPAGVRSASGAVEALRKIAAGDAVFISRGDHSGTHEREMELWRQAQIDPANERILTSGSSMAATLRQADARAAYTLSDDATWRQLRDALKLEALLANDATLLNGYAVIYPEGSTRAAALAHWLAEGGGRERIAAFRAGGHQPFMLWPAGCPGDRPAAPLCR